MMNTLASLSGRATSRALRSHLPPAGRLFAFLAPNTIVFSGTGVRGYASKRSKQKADPKAKVTDLEDGSAKSKARAPRLPLDFVPGSQKAVGPEYVAEYETTDARMKAAVEWFRKEVAAMESRGSGRVTPDLLSHVQVVLPGTSARLPDIATVGVRDGTTLIVTVFEDENTKQIEKALYAAKIPHVVPQRVDNRTIKIPMPKPTVEARAELVKAAAKQAEDTRVQLRKHEAAGIKRTALTKHMPEYEEFNKLTQKHSKEVNEILTAMKKSMGVK